MARRRATADRAILRIIENLMSPTTIQLNPYTDLRELHPNIIVSSFQLIAWFILHPTAWINYAARMYPDLSPNFTLFELNSEQLRNPILKRLMVITYGVWPLLIALLVGLVLWALGESGKFIAIGVAFGVGLHLAGSIGGGFALGYAGWAVTGLVGGVVGGIASSLCVHVASTTETVTITTVRVAVISSMMAGVIGISILSDVASALEGGGRTYRVGRQMGAVSIGVLIGGGMFFIGTNLAIKPTNILIVALMGAMASGIAATVRRGFMFGVIAGLVFGLTIAGAFYLAFSIGSLWVGVAFALMAATFVAPPYIVAEGLAGARAGVVAAAIGSVGGFVAFLIVVSNFPLWPLYPLSLIGMLVGLSFIWLRPALLYPFELTWNIMLHRADERRPPSKPSLLPWNTAFWDEFQRLKLVGLDEHVVMVAERNAAEGQAAIEYLAATPQRWAAQAAQIELDARLLERCENVEAISGVHRRLAAGELEGPASSLLRSFSRLSQDVDAAKQQDSSYNQRIALSAVEYRLNDLLRELNRSNEPYGARFNRVAVIWRKIVAEHVRELAEAVEQRQEIDSPYVIGVPLTEQQEIFVGRADVTSRIEQLLLDRRRPPLLLYGQRRMGKTSLLHNLGRLLPSTIVPLFVDLQGPHSRTTDYSGFLYNIARNMIDSAERKRGHLLPPLQREELEGDPFTQFDDWLSQVEKALGDNTALLILDEIEALDTAITKGRFDEEDILGMLRHLIQNRPRFKVLLASSHTLDELKRWASYLINVQVVPISYLKESEAYQLIERPVKNFALRYEPDASRRVITLTRAHPALVQLLCAEIIALKNEQEPSIRRSARVEDVERAVPEALSHGSFFFFSDIETKQVDAAGVSLLRFMASKGEGAVIDKNTLASQLSGEIDQALSLLTKRDLIEPVDGGYRFQVELIRRWFTREW